MKLFPVLRVPICIVLSSCIFLLADEAVAQEKTRTEIRVPETNPATRAEPPAPIQDNSFLIEEAYNQEDGVVQHIQTFTRYWASKDWVYSFTQEWPGTPNFRHQFSYSILAQSAGAYPGSGAGIGDAMLNYRYQVIGNGETRFAFSPRVSALLPSGNSKVGRGFGGWGVQASLPASFVVTPRLVTHWNIGTTIVPRAQDAAGDKALSTGYNLGQSVVWLATPRFNVLMETVWNGSESVVGPHQTQRVHSLFLSPGIRWAYNLNHHLQIVPGVAVPLGVGPSGGERGLLVYLSFEHPMWKSQEEKAKSLANDK